MRTLAFVSVACLFLSFMQALFQSKAADGGHAYLNLTLANHTDEEIDETAIQFGKNRCTSGILGVGAANTYLGWQKPVGTNAIVKWRDGKQVRREATVSLTNIYNPRIDGTLTFTINKTNVAVSFEKVTRKR